ncbi:uncharacterized protein LOC110901318 [Helianthus annuus]|uniref:uncharacterized protein LOC110901318 n=1 Tax=Helianthus annuus TaxID=4232 RepID=UPI000B8FA31E|nr:uncharacterized protein LOC110901318 [Helianthus annuus]
MVGKIIKFFVSNLPEGCTPWELRRCLESFGVVAGTYVAKKRDKGGCRFGFVSYKDVRDKEELEKALRGVKMGDCKLKVNVARFAMENAGVEGTSVGGVQATKPFVAGVNYAAFGGKDGRSYSEVVGAKRSGGESSRGGGSVQVKSMDREEERSVVVPDRMVAFQELRGLAVVGRTANLETLVDFDKLLRIAKIGFKNIQYLGGLSILVSFENSEGARSFLSSKKVWEPWFSKLESWEGQALPLERVIWLKISGVPLHLLNPEILDMVGGVFGKVLYVKKSFLEEKDLSVTRVAVLAGEAYRVREMIKVVWKDRSFRVWVEEEAEDWIPDCLRFGEMDVDGSSSPYSDEPVANTAGSSPLASSPVVECSEMGSQGVVEGGIEGSKSEGEQEAVRKAAGAGPNGVGDMGNVFNYDSFLGNASGSPSASLKKKKGLFVFSARKKSKRQRKGVSLNKGSPLGQLDSSEKSRPCKRNRSDLEENSDPFSLDKFLGPTYLNSKSGGEDKVSRVGGEDLSPDAVGGVPFDLNHRADADLASSSNRQGEGMEGNSGGGSGDVDQEVRVTVCLGVRIGMELNGKEDLIKRVVQGSGINVVQS